MNPKHEPGQFHYAVIFLAELSDDLEDYQETAQAIRDLAMKQPGFLGIESVYEGRREITVSYWESEQAVRAWKQVPQHLEAQKRGKVQWYSGYRVQVARIERAYRHPPTNDH